MSDYPSVLYVEDDLHNRLVMEILLKEEMGLTTVTIFEDSRDFEARVDNLAFVPDIIFLDIHVTPIDGFGMLELLRANQKFANTPILAITASVMNEEVEQLKNSGFDGAIAKPIQIDTFPQIVKQALEGQKVWNIA